VVECARVRAGQPQWAGRSLRPASSLVTFLSYCALLGACSSKPSSYGVNVTVTATALSVADRARIARALVQVSGDETYAKSLSVSSQLQDGTLRVHYVPGIPTGTIRFAVAAVASDDSVIASGDSGDIHLVAAKAIDAAVILQLGASVDMGGGTKMAGEPCSSSSECATAGGCADGVCCDKPCSASCVSCNQAGSVGQCLPVPAGSAPLATHPSCTADSSCSVCDGMGSCTAGSAGTPCRSAACTNGTATALATCDSTLKCPAPVTKACDPYACGSTDCKTRCDIDADCASTAYCGAGNQCVPKKPLATSCGGPNECGTGYCVNGVCCDVGCTGACTACNVSGSIGHCSYVAQGTDDPRCPHDAASTCGHTGKCDAAGACAYYDAGTACGSAPACSANQLGINGTATCPGNGAACGAPPFTSCGHYTCYMMGSTPQCYLDCGGSCAINGVCMMNPLLQSRCAPGYTCTSHCNGACVGYATCD
jgi:hypothetical protein